MGISAKLLSEGEHVVVSTRTHVKALLRPVLLFIVVCAATGLLVALIPYDVRWLGWIPVALAAVVLARWVLWPTLGWLGATYTVTNRRLITRTGVVTRTGRDIPLQRINDVSYEHGLVDRLFGCGTLVISAASERGQVVLPDVPQVERLQLTLTDLLGDADDDRGTERP